MRYAGTQAFFQELRHCRSDQVRATLLECVRCGPINPINPRNPRNVRLGCVCVWCVCFRSSAAAAATRWSRPTRLICFLVSASCFLVFGFRPV